MEEPGRPRWAHNPEIAGSNPAANNMNAQKPRTAQVFEAYIKTSNRLLRKSPEQITDEVAATAHWLLDVWGSEIDTRLGEKFLASVKDLTTRVIRREVESVLRGES